MGMSIIALHCLQQLGYEVYAPRLRTYRVIAGRKIVQQSLLFPSYAFISIIAQWHAARWAAGVIRLVMAGDTTPARVPDAVITELRRSEINGAIVLTKPSSLQRGDRVRILRGPFRDQLAIFSDMKPRERVEILLGLLGASRSVVLSLKDVEPARSNGDGDRP
jgi:transcription antitermination factor NusG